MIKYLTILALFLLPTVSKAACYDRDFSHKPECERFTLFEDTSQMAHFWAGAAITTGGTLVFERLGMSPLPATLSALAITMIIGAAKETMVDAYVSRNGILSMWAGGVVAAPIVFALTF